MNHKFKGSTTNPAICVKCNYDVTAHSEFATCQVCKKFPCTVNEYPNLDTLMCDGCYASEHAAQQELKNGAHALPETIARLEQERFGGLAGEIEGIIQNTSPLTDLPMNGDEFFNAETVSHVELEKKIFADADIAEKDKWEFYVKQMQLRHAHLQTALASGIKLLKEVRSRLAASQRTMNVTASKLRADQREKLKVEDINYKPVAAPKKVVARVTEKNKVVINIAQVFCAPRDAKGNFIWQELTDEQREECLVKARQIFSNNMSSINAATKELNKDNQQ